MLEIGAGMSSYMKLNLVINFWIGSRYTSLVFPVLLPDLKKSSVNIRLWLNVSEFSMFDDGSWLPDYTHETIKSKIKFFFCLNWVITKNIN